MVDKLNDKVNGEKIYGRGPIWHVIREIRGQGLHILDMGCGAGGTGEELQKRGHTVYGVDISPQAIMEARRRLTRAEIVDLDRADTLPFEKGFFDCIILADVLEHLYKPERTLQMVRDYLKDSGYIIVSIPNIANYVVRWNLLLGNFSSGESPIVGDPTHIRFFTLKTVKDLVEKACFQIEKINCTAGIYLPLGGLYLFGVPVIQRLREIISRSWKTMFATQFVIIARKQ